VAGDGPKNNDKELNLLLSMIANKYGVPKIAPLSTIINSETKTQTVQHFRYRWEEFNEDHSSYLGTLGELGPTFVSPIISKISALVSGKPTIQDFFSTLSRTPSDLACWIECRMRCLEEDHLSNSITTEQYQAGAVMLNASASILGYAIACINRSVPSAIKKAKLWAVLENDMFLIQKIGK